jgi:hypothetical protein
MAALGLDGVVIDHRGAWRPDRQESARAFREDRGRFHKRLRVLMLVAGLGVFGLCRIWLSTEISSQQARLTGLRERYKILATDLTVAQVKLDQRRMFGALLVPAERAGFASAVDRRCVEVERPAAAPAPSAWAQLGDEVRRGSQLVLPEAFAQGRRDMRGDRDHGTRP